MGLDGLFAMKALVLAERARSRDLFDLMTLIRDHGFRLADAFNRVQTLAPIEQRDVERHKAVMTGLIALDRVDEGFDSLRLNTSIGDIYDFFDAQISRFERDAAREVWRQAGEEPGDAHP